MVTLFNTECWQCLWHRYIISKHQSTNLYGGTSEIIYLGLRTLIYKYYNLMLVPISCGSRLAGIFWFPCWSKCPGPFKLNSCSDLLYTSSMGTLDYLSLHLLCFLNRADWCLFHLFITFLLCCLLGHWSFLGCRSLSWGCLGWKGK